ncbi:hypothetical protein BJF78_04175 [Pseudonocardia sp. CNS-139]|nr:hypothetical protein BJF78_04175 [Pseudonocardia sp. CNS-139]
MSDQTLPAPAVPTRVEPRRHRHPRAVGGSARDRQTWSRRVHDLLRADIRSGMIARDYQLVEDTLVQRLATSRRAVREALQQLAAEGLVTRVPRRGTRVTRDIVELPLTDIRPLTGTEEFSIRRIDCRVVPSTPLIRKRLRTDAEVVGFVEHFFLQRGEPVGVRAVYHHTSTVQPEAWDYCPSLAFAFEHVFGRPLARIESTIDAVACDQQTSALLGLPVGAPVLVNEQVLVDAAGCAQEFTFTRYRADRVSLSSDTTLGPRPAGRDDRGPVVWAGRALHGAPPTPRGPCE